MEESADESPLRRLERVYDLPETVVSDEDVALLRNTVFRFSEHTSYDTIRLIGIWARSVDTLTREIDIPANERTDMERYADDLLLILFRRDELEDCLGRLPKDLVDRLHPLIAALDDRYKSITFDDGGEAMNRHGRRANWWWNRRPTHGPIADELADRLGSRNQES